MGSFSHPTNLCKCQRILFILCLVPVRAAGRNRYSEILLEIGISYLIVKVTNRNPEWDFFFSLEVTEEGQVALLVGIYTN